MKKILSYLLVFLITSTMIVNTSILSFADNKTLDDSSFDQVDLISNFGIVIDYETGKVLAGKNIHKKIYPASTTKVWTAYLTLKYVKDLNEPVKIEKDLAVEGSSMYLQKGEMFTVKELLQGLLIHSSNDAAVVLAEHVSGSVEAFVELMNKEAKEAGALNTNFVNPHGYHDDNHYSTPYDMVLFAREAMNNKTFREIVNTKYVSFSRIDNSKSVVLCDRYFKNTNYFLASNESMMYKGKTVPIEYSIVDGIKTGYTDDAGRCLLSSAVKNDMRVIAGVFKDVATDVYVDSRTLLDYALNNYYSHNIVDKDKYTETRRVLLTKEKEFIYQPKSSYKIITKRGEKVDTSGYSYKEKLDFSLPIYKGDKVGTLEIYHNNELEKTIDLVSTSEIHSKFAFFTENKIVKILFKIILFVIGLFALYLLFLLARKKYRRSIKKGKKVTKKDPKKTKKEPEDKKIKKVKKVKNPKKVKKVKKDK